MRNDFSFLRDLFPLDIDVETKIVSAEVLFPPAFHGMATLCNAGARVAVRFTSRRAGPTLWTVAVHIAIRLRTLTEYADCRRPEEIRKPKRKRGKNNRKKRNNKNLRPKGTS